VIDETSPRRLLRALAYRRWTCSGIMSGISIARQAVASAYAELVTKGLA
jgi:hypothetical protein